MKSSKNLQLSLLATLILSACGGSSSDSKPVPPPAGEASACGTISTTQTCAAVDGAFGKGLYILEKPANTANAPILIGLHGAPGSPNELNAYLHVTDMAASEGYLVALPFGAGNWGWSSQIENDGILSKDSQFMQALVDDLVEKHQGDRSRVFVLGYSAGGFMAYQLACEIPEQFAGLISIAGQIRGTIENCQPATGVAIHHIHGLSDLDVPFEGRADGIASVQETMTHFAQINRCANNTEDWQEAGLTTDNKAANTAAYQGCLNQLKLTTIERTGHRPAFEMTVLHNLIGAFISEHEQ
ncbi:CE1 family esterase [Bowmanella dokdonensis]|uniref:Prolyl oligopeptidase family serine peptidase n=1 Tax=Bowmanella dokdonensis TaxID=751969 RepID=A0A939DRZ6_9ALTE|nr:prolyl oligopeptidase family serine peptidase [Bowmanella dokdonensis]MBN7827722.1 prolyl oligopeptidase family serine peptidase [Bowmanella dokdonensis]